MLLNLVQTQIYPENEFVLDMTDIYINDYNHLPVKSNLFETEYFVKSLLQIGFSENEIKNLGWTEDFKNPILDSFFQTAVFDKKTTNRFAFSFNFIKIDITLNVTVNLGSIVGIAERRDKWSLEFLSRVNDVSLLGLTGQGLSLNGQYLLVGTPSYRKWVGEVSLFQKDPNESNLMFTFKKINQNNSSFTGNGISLPDDFEKQLEFGIYCELSNSFDLFNDKITNYVKIFNLYLQGTVFTNSNHQLSTDNNRLELLVADQDVNTSFLYDYDERGELVVIGNDQQMLSGETQYIYTNIANQTQKFKVPLQDFVTYVPNYFKVDIIVGAIGIQRMFQNINKLSGNTIIEMGYGENCGVLDVFGETNPMFDFIENDIVKINNCVNSRDFITEFKDSSDISKYQGFPSTITQVCQFGERGFSLKPSISANNKISPIFYNFKGHRLLDAIDSTLIKYVPYHNTTESKKEFIENYQVSQRFKESMFQSLGYLQDSKKYDFNRGVINQQELLLHNYLDCFYDDVFDYSGFNTLFHDILTNAIADTNEVIKKYFRIYDKVGTDGDVVWASFRNVNKSLVYKYVENKNGINIYKNSSINDIKDDDEVFDYPFIERIKGIEKILISAKHKSNYFSVVITNSGLNDGLDEIGVPEKIKLNIQESIEKVLRKDIEYFTPANTQLLNILWKGK